LAICEVVSAATEAAAVIVLSPDAKKEDHSSPVAICLGAGELPIPV
jgi:hypothetical protein